MSKKKKQSLVNQIKITHPITKKDYYTPESDVVFRTIMSKTEHTLFPQKFLEGILGKKVGPVTVNVNRDIEVNNVDEKQMVADVKMVSKENSAIYMLEMQTSAHNSITKRFSSYISGEHKAQVKRSIPYTEVPPITLIVILTKNIPKFLNVKKYQSVWNYREEDYSTKIFDKDLTIYLIELPKYIEHKHNTKEFNIWLEFISNPFGKEVQEAMKTNKELRIAVDLLNMLNSDTETSETAWRELLDEMDKKSALEDAKEDARNRGIQEGEQKGQKILIKRMIENGTSISQIAEMLRIDTPEVEKMLN